MDPYAELDENTLKRSDWTEAKLQAFLLNSEKREEKKSISLH